MDLTTMLLAANQNIDVDIYEQAAEPEIEKTMASKNHAKIQSRLAKILGNAYDENFDIFTEFEVEIVGKKVIPDVSIYPIEPSDWDNDVIRGDTAPILAIEILSPRQAFDEVVTKIKEVYFPAGSKSAWIVLPKTRMVMLFTPDDEIQTFRKGILQDKASGFDIDLNKVFN
jgi:Uma2 family endonuclease